MEKLANAWERMEAGFCGAAGQFLRWTFFIVMALAIIASFSVEDAPAFQKPELARIFFWHFPCPMISSWLLAQGGWYSFRVLQTRSLKWDVKAIAALELGMVFSLLTMATGMLFSEVQWGAFWQWDPRQTSYLLVLILYAAYFVMRASFADRDRAAANSAGYALAATLPAMFLIFVFPRLPQIAGVSFHPTQTIWEGQVKGNYAYVIIATLTLTSILSMWLFRLRVRAGLLELKTYESFGLETDRGGAATPRVVRPVRLPSDDGSEASPSEGSN